MIKRMQFLAISSLLYVSQKLPGITFWLFLLCFGQNLKKTPVPDDSQLTIYKLKLTGIVTFLKLKVHIVSCELPGTCCIFWKQSGTTFIFDSSFWQFPAHRKVFAPLENFQVSPRDKKILLTKASYSGGHGIVVNVFQVWNSTPSSM